MSVTSIPPKKLAIMAATISLIEGNRIVTLEEIEKRVIVFALNHCDDVSQTARQLGIGRSTLYRKMERYRIRKRPR